MHSGLRIGRMVIGLTAIMAAAQLPHRRIIIVGRSDDAYVLQQHAALEQDFAALRERDVVVQEMTPEMARRERPGLATDPQAAFEVLLLGRDGGVKLRRTKPVAASEITALIDTMPMRQSEMRQ